MDLKILRPIKSNCAISLRFGEAPEWYTKITGYPHNGIDFVVPVGTPVLACDDGVIEYADNVPDKDGLGINLWHAWGLSQYWHLSELSVRYKQVIKRGDVLGLSGASGWATGPHLHFGIRIKDIYSEAMRGWNDPALYFETQITPYDPAPIGNQKVLVMPGDSLWKIAQKYYGWGGYWTKIYEANKDKIKDPNIIYPLQLLNLP
jgi:murein DD-endopeptidase MepM/ murein hydrolase activator NlpD